jgi:hypothetical protein
MSGAGIRVAALWPNLRCSGITFASRCGGFFFCWLFGFGVAGLAFCFHYLAGRFFVVFSSLVGSLAEGLAFGSFWWIIGSFVLVLFWGVSLVLFVALPSTLCTCFVL